MHPFWWGYNYAERARFVLRISTGCHPSLIYKAFSYIKTHGSESRGQEKRPRDDYQESIYAYQNVLNNGKQN